jgi:hypothetical protein
LRVLNKLTQVKEKTPRACWIKGKFEARKTFAEKLTTSGSLLSMF